MAKPIKHGHAWRIRWVDETGARRSECFCSFKDAEYALKKYETEVEDIKKGIRLPTLPNKSFADLCNSYLKYRSSQKRNPQDDESIIRVHLKPFFKEMPLTHIGLMVNEFRLSKQSLNPKTIHNILTLLISMLRFAHEEKWLLSVPTIKKPKIRLINSDFHYLRTPEEINRFLVAAKLETEMAYYLYATAIYTGMRAGELAGLQWSDIDFSKRLITVQRSYNGPTKNGEIRHIPILDVLLPLLIDWRQKTTIHSLVFPNESGFMQQESAYIFQEILHRVLDRAGFCKDMRAGKLKRYIVFHDLRHTFASHWMMNNGNIFKLQKILGHKSHQMTQRYAHLEPAAFVEDYSRFGFLAPKSDKLVSIK
jgi:integrase